MIDVRNLTKFYGRRAALRDVTFSVAAGETVGFLGPNGAGKSTTMRILTGFLRPTSGQVTVCGCDVLADSAGARAQLGYLPESNPLYGELRVSEFLHHRARLKGLDRSGRAAAVGQALEQCHLRDVSGRIIGQLSKGYRQRVGLAACLLGDPRLLILDEPTVGLDPNQVVEMRRLIREVGRDRTVFLSSHILHEVELACRQVVIVHQGRIVASGSTQDLCERYSPWRELRMQIRGEDVARETLERLPGVQRVEMLGETLDGAREILLRCDKAEDLRPVVARLALEKGWLLQEMRLEPMRLEEIFVRLTATPAAVPEEVSHACAT